ncbi:transporter substrate-binding domain-containing protein [Epibacterium ulvae]|uniref:transporter substrate-binding domain-containing protein n=1 Tax=Epibacterium ulvae TaxID=1156985 RepID=UPI002491ADF1|nr:transporter substrate-binding domain-containing protein [Epibacterium ulvae]
MITKLTRLVSPIALAVGLLPSAALAICDVDYVARPGDNLFSIADEHYGDRDKWRLIFEQNTRMLAGSTVIPGRTLRIPCPEEEATASAPAVPTPAQPSAPAQPAPAVSAAPAARQSVELTLLTGNGFAPFTGENLPGQGMVTELFTAAMQLAPSQVSYDITWDDNWDSHLFPKLNDKQFDMGFPWVKPDCIQTPDHERCVNFHFSDPLISLPVMLFVKAGNEFSYTSDADVVGKTLCRPEGYYTHDLDTEVRRWLSDGKVTLVQPESVQACFSLLNEERVDAVALNLFEGANTIVKENLRDTVVPLERPLSEVGLHVVISKSHWRGTSHLYRVNAGLKKLRENGQFEAIMNKHLELFWADLRS